MKKVFEKEKGLDRVTHRVAEVTNCCLDRQSKQRQSTQQKEDKGIEVILSGKKKPFH